MKNKKNKLYLVITSLLVAMVLTACGGGADATQPQPTPVVPGQEGGQAPEATVGGGVLRFVSHISISTSGYVPELTGNAALPFITLAHESLLMFDEQGNFYPSLALSWESDPSEPSITWNLRQGVYFSDGEPFNAEAVRVTVEEYQRFGRGEVANVAGFEIIDNYTIKMLLYQWDSSMLESIGFFVYFMSPVALQDIDSLRTSSAGTGPFRVVDFQPGVRVVYERNELHWREGRPFLDGVEMHIIEEPTTRASAFQAGEFDVMFMNSLVIGQQIMATNEYILLENLSGAGLVSVGLIPNSRAEGSPFADPRVRQAMSYAIDEEALARTFGFGLLQTTNQWAAPGSVTFNPAVRGFPYNPERARELLAEAGFPNGFDTNIFTVIGQRDMITAASYMLEQVGIRAAVVQIDEPTQTSFMGEGWDGIMMHFHAISPNLGLYMGRHLDGAFYVSGLLIPDEVMELLGRIRSAPTEEERIRLEHEMQILIYDELALFGQPLWINREPVFTQQNVRDTNFSVRHLWTWTPWDMWIER
ncbi:MAG: ABC transporter substrate-binding protein [Defluviitaleaceae bacterium]|nr:ABC transporter substrate-binding protein [Defluviitaleaceae bacterium]